MHIENVNVSEVELPTLVYSHRIVELLPRRR